MGRGGAKPGTVLRTQLEPNPWTHHLPTQSDCRSSGDPETAVAKD